jgi:hypothetical protein
MAEPGQEAASNAQELSFLGNQSAVTIVCLTNGLDGR